MFRYTPLAPRVRIYSADAITGSALRARTFLLLCLALLFGHFIYALPHVDLFVHSVRQRSMCMIASPANFQNNTPVEERCVVTAFHNFLKREQPKWVNGTAASRVFLFKHHFLCVVSASRTSASRTWFEEVGVNVVACRHETLFPIRDKYPAVDRSTCPAREWLLAFVVGATQSWPGDIATTRADGFGTRQKGPRKCSTLQEISIKARQGGSTSLLPSRKVFFFATAETIVGATTTIPVHQLVGPIVNALTPRTPARRAIYTTLFTPRLHPTKRKNNQYLGQLFRPSRRALSPCACKQHNSNSTTSFIKRRPRKSAV